MTMQISRLDPQAFAEGFLDALDKESLARHSLGAYESNPKAWTKHSMGVAEAFILGLVPQQSDHPRWRTSREYLRVDLIGYISNWYAPDREERTEDWEMKIAFEHENSDSWHDELCKLSHVVADLRVIVSYHDFAAKPIEELLARRVTAMGHWRMSRVPDSRWLFVIGPRHNYSEPFRAFTLGPQLGVVEIPLARRVTPDQWK